MTRALPSLLTLAVVLIALPSSAHEARPIHVQIVETAPGVHEMDWKVPASVPVKALPTPILPDYCAAEGEPLLRKRAGEFVGQQVVRCAEPLAGGTLRIDFPIINPSLSTLFQVRSASGEKHVRILKPGETEWTVPERESKLAVAKEYLALGIEHIWTGVDHLLFVACLLLVCRTPRTLLITITGFTLAHSVTLVLSALGLVRVPVPPVEAAIALSVVFLAYEITKGDESSLTFRYPIAVSTTFGLLHGFGFAAVLREIGLPQTELPTALFFFNVGVEVGQIVFVVALATLYVAIRAFAGRASSSGRLDDMWSLVRVPASYVIGGVASYWMVDRIVGFWG